MPEHQRVHQDKKAAPVRTAEAAAPVTAPAAAVLVEGRFAPTVQRSSLVVGRADDPAELEADVAAERVVAELRRSSHAGSPPLRRSAPGVGDDPCGGQAAPAGFTEAISRRRGAGAALPGAVARSMSTAFGSDLSEVRVHHDVEADTLARSVSANAFTVGQDIYFSRGSFAPHTPDGQRLLAHELTHVVQQGGTLRRDPAKKVKDMTSDEGRDTMAEVQAKVQGFLDLRDKLIAKGMDAESAAKTAFAMAPEEVKRFLPLHSEFDFTKRRIDKRRTAEGALAQSEISKVLTDHAREHGYVPGDGTPGAATPEDIAKQLVKDRAFRQQVERQAERQLLLEMQSATKALKAAEKKGDTGAITQAQQRIDELKQPGAVQKFIDRIHESDDQAALQKADAKALAYEEEHGKPPSPAERWRLEESARKEVRKNREAGQDSHLTTATSVIGGVGTAGYALSESPSALTAAGKKVGSGLGKVLKGMGKTFKGAVSDISAGVNYVTGAFADVVKLVQQIRDAQSAKSDGDAGEEIAAQVENVIGDAAWTAQEGLTIAQDFGSAVADSAAVTLGAIPGLSIVGYMASFCAYVIGIKPPALRIHNTAKTRKSALKAKNQPMVAALNRTDVDNSLDVSTQVTNASISATQVGLSIAELATAGGFGVPAAAKLVLTGAKYAKKAADALTRDSYAAKAQLAREAGAGQKEGSGERLISHDVTYSVDTIIMAAKDGLEKKKAGRPWESFEADAVQLINSYGISYQEADRLSMRELHERMLDKLSQDDEQDSKLLKVGRGLKSGAKEVKNLVTKPKETLKRTGGAVKDFFGSLGGGGSDDSDVDLDTYLQNKKNKTEKSVGQKILGFAKKVVTAPVTSVKELDGLRREKLEKVKRILQVKNELEYKDRSDRGSGFLAKEFLVDVDKTEQNLRRWIVATQPKMRAELYLSILNTTSQQNTVDELRKRKDDQRSRAQESVTDRVIDPAIFTRGPTMTLDEIDAELTRGGLGKASREYLAYVRKQKVAAGEKPGSGGKKLAKVGS